MKRQLPFFYKASIYLNGFLGLAPIVLFFVGLFLAQVIIKDVDIKQYLYLQNKTTLIEGEVFDRFRTNLTINEEAVFGYKYSFASPVGLQKGISYCTGKRNSNDNKVVIEYATAHPNIHRIKGLSNTPGGFVSFVFLMPLLAGLIWLLVNLYKGRIKLKVITEGTLGYGTLIEKRKTLTRINNRPVYKLIFEFRNEKRNIYNATARTHKPGRLLDDAEEMLYYDKTNPKKAVLVDDLPWGTPRYIKANWIKTKGQNSPVWEI